MSKPVVTLLRAHLRLFSDHSFSFRIQVSLGFFDQGGKACFFSFINLWFRHMRERKTGIFHQTGATPPGLHGLSVQQR